MSTVSIKINENKLVKNLGYSFSNSTTVLAEFLQNARRSGASEIRFYFNEDGQILKVIDNGSGIADMQNLLAVADSGWDEEIVKTEKPFGMGWLSAVYSAQRIIVKSMGSSIDFLTEDVLAFSQIDVERINHGFVGTIMELHGFKLGDNKEPVMGDLESALARYAKGFPIRVYLDDAEIDRPHALDGDFKFAHYSPIGDMHIAGMPGMSESGHNTAITVYLQGLPIYDSSSYSYDKRNVIHLNSEMFDARLPDRDKLIDETENLGIINERIRNEWRDYLTTLIFAGRGEELITRWEDVLSSFNLKDLLNQVDFIPPGYLSVVDNYPLYNVHWDNDTSLNTMHKRITREMVECGEVTLVKHMCMSPENVPYWMMMHTLESESFYFLSEGSLPADHWAQAYALDWENTEFEIKPLGNIEKGAFNGDWYDGSVVFCDAYRLTIDDHTQVIDSLSLGHGDCYSNPTFYVPLKDRGGEVVNQCCSFNDEHDNIDERAREREEKLFTLFVLLHREKTPAAVVQSLLNEEYLGRFNGLNGTYNLIVSGSKIHVHSKRNWLHSFSHSAVSKYLQRVFNQGAAS